MLEYAPMLHVSYYAQNYAGIIRHDLDGFLNSKGCVKGYKGYSGLHNSLSRQMGLCTRTK